MSKPSFKLKNPRKGTETLVQLHVMTFHKLGAFKLKNPRKGTETRQCRHHQTLIAAFKLKNPWKGTETFIQTITHDRSNVFQIKESPEGDWNRYGPKAAACFVVFQIKESPEGDWNNPIMQSATAKHKAFKLKNPRKGTETQYKTSKQSLQSLSN